MSDVMDRLGQHVAETAAAFAYPATPDVAATLRAERMAVALKARERARRTRTTRWAMLAVVAIIALGIGLWSVPPVRAAIVSILRIGTVQIELAPTPQPPPTALPAIATQASQSTPATLPTPIKPTPTPPPLGSALDLGGETTLEKARSTVAFPIKLPNYPADLGRPDAVFVQDIGDQTVVLVWLDPALPRRARLVLQILAPNAFVFKMEPRKIAETEVNGQRAIWAEGEYLLRSRSGDTNLRRLITGSTLIWTEGDLTYRLETDLAMDEAVKIAESVR